MDAVKSEGPMAGRSLAGAPGAGRTAAAARRRRTGGERRYKRLFDLCTLALLLAVLLPFWIVLCAAIAVAIRLEGGGPVLYRQVRLGLGGRSLRILKFRTMREGGPDPDDGPILVLDGVPVPREQFVQPVLQSLGDATEDVCEPGLRIDVVELGAGEGRVPGCSERSCPRSQATRAGGGCHAMTKLVAVHRDQLRALRAWVATPVIRSRQFSMSKLTPKLFARIVGSRADR